MNRAQAEQIIQHVVGAAKGLGLEFNFDVAVATRSFDAYRLMQFAKTMNLGDEREEQLFKAYFTNGENI